MLEVDLTVTSEAPHGFLEMPDLRRQRSLRSWFKVDGDPGRAWHPDGTRFRVRVRPLTTRVQAVPSVEVQVFDPEAGTYAMVTTEPVPIVVRSEDGRDYFDAKTLSGDAAGLTDQPEGVWQNDRRQSHERCLEHHERGAVGVFLALDGPRAGVVRRASAVGPGRPAAGAAIRPTAAWSRRMTGFAGCRKGVPRSGRPCAGCWRRGSGLEPEALTGRDVRQRPRGHGVSEEDLAVLTDSVVELDAAEFSQEKKTAVVPRLGGAGERIFRVLREMVMVVAGAC